LGISSIRKYELLKLGLGVHPYNPSTWEVEKGRSPVQGQPGLHSEFQVIRGYIVRPFQNTRAGCIA
jgi:hypothetical protein